MLAVVARTQRQGVVAGEVGMVRMVSTVAVLQVEEDQLVTTLGSACHHRSGAGSWKSRATTVCPWGEPERHHS